MFLYMAKNSGKPSPQMEDKKGEAWFAQHHDNDPYDAFKSKEDMDRIGLEIFSRVTQQKNGPKIRRLNILKYAAAVLLFVGSVFFAYYTLPQNPGQSHRAEWTSLVNNSGSNKIVRLADSSTIIMRAGATMRVSANYGKKIRLVRLDRGEAYFDVQKDPAHPFIVSSGTAQVKVLGTAFNVIHAEGSKNIDVTVSHGKVRVSDSGIQLAVLTKGNRIRYNGASHELKLEQVPVSAVSAWRQPSVELSNASFGELSEIFNSFYGVTLEAGVPHIKTNHYTITISRESSAISTARIIAKIHGLNLSASNGKITLHD